MQPSFIKNSRMIIHAIGTDAVAEHEFGMCFGKIRYLVMILSFDERIIS